MTPQEANKGLLVWCPDGKLARIINSHPSSFIARVRTDEGEERMLNVSELKPFTDDDYKRNNRRSGR